MFTSVHLEKKTSPCSFRISDLQRSLYFHLYQLYQLFWTSSIKVSKAQHCIFLGEKKTMLFYDTHKITILEPCSCCSWGTLQWQWVLLYKHLARQVLHIYLLQIQWRFARKRQREGRPMSILMHSDRQADSVCSTSALVPHSLSLSHLLHSVEVTGPRLWHMWSVSVTGQKAIGAAIRHNMKVLFVLSPVRGGSRSGKLSPTSTHMT